MDTITGMRTFAAVVSAGSFTSASERLGISKALTSKYVAALEERLSVRLLNRTTRKISVTETGQAYYLRCKQLLEDFDQLEAAIRDEHKAPEGRLRVSAPATFAELYLTQAVSDFLNQQPGISVELVLADRFVNIVDEGFDLAVRIGHLADSTLVARRLATTRVIAVASPSYLEKAGEPNSPDDLERHHCIIDTNFGSGNTWSFIQDNQSFNVGIKGRFAVNNAYAVKEMVLADQGIGLCPDYVVGKELRSNSLKVILAGYDIQKYGIYAVYPHNRHLAGATRSFVDFLVQQFNRKTSW